MCFNDNKENVCKENDNEENNKNNGFKTHESYEFVAALLGETFEILEKQYNSYYPLSFEQISNVWDVSKIRLVFKKTLLKSICQKYRGVLGSMIINPTLEIVKSDKIDEEVLNTLLSEILISLNKNEKFLFDKKQNFVYPELLKIGRYSNWQVLDKEIKRLLTSFINQVYNILSDFSEIAEDKGFVFEDFKKNECANRFNIRKKIATLTHILQSFNEIRCHYIRKKLGLDSSKYALDPKTKEIIGTVLPVISVNNRIYRLNGSAPGELSCLAQKAGLEFKGDKCMFNPSYGIVEFFEKLDECANEQDITSGDKNFRNS